MLIERFLRANVLNLASICLFGSFPSLAANVTFGPSSAVLVADRVATFDSVRTGTDLSSYTEDDLSVTIGTTAYREFAVGSGYFSPGLGFSGGFHYPRGGYPRPTVIRGTDWRLMNAVEFTLGTGFFAPANQTYVAWETMRSGQRLDAGWFLADLSNQVVVGLAEALGFDELRVANYHTLAEVQAGVSQELNAIALDNVRVQLQQLQNDSASVPEPAASILALAGLLALVTGRQLRGGLRD